MMSKAKSVKPTGAPNIVKGNRRWAVKATLLLFIRAMIHDFENIWETKLKFRSLIKFCLKKGLGGRIIPILECYLLHYLHLVDTLKHLYTLHTKVCFYLHVCIFPVRTANIILYLTET